MKNLKIAKSIDPVNIPGVFSQYEPSGMTAFIIVNEEEDNNKIIDNIKKTIESCQGTLIDEWILIGGDQSLALVTKANYSVIDFAEGIDFQQEKNKWSIILYPGEILKGAMDKFLVCVYRQADYHVVSLNVQINDKDMVRCIRLFKKGVNPNELYKYSYQHFLAHEPAYILNENSI